MDLRQAKVSAGNARRAESPSLCQRTTLTFSFSREEVSLADVSFWVLVARGGCSGFTYTFPYSCSLLQ